MYCNITNKNFNIILSKVLKHSLSSVLSSSISMKSRGGVQQKSFIFIDPFFPWKWKYAKKRKGYEYMKLWHLCLTPTHLWYMSQFLLQKKLCFETGTHPPFGPMSQNTQFFFLKASLSDYSELRDNSKLRVSIMKNYSRCLISQNCVCNWVYI